MDFNDLKNRLGKTFTSIGNFFDYDVVGGSKVTDEDMGSHHTLTVTFGNDDYSTLENKIFLVLYNLSSVKDHLKNCLANTGYDPKEVENEIDNSLHLRVLIDLVNQEKHGYPLRKRNRSGKNPIIKNVEQVLTLRKNPKREAPLSISFSSDGTVTSEGNSSIDIVADIFDENDNILFDLDELVETCYTKFEHIAKKYGCIS
jgi:hypothetical protein